MVELAADMYSEEDGRLNFCILVEATAAEVSEVRALSRTSGDSKSAIMVVASIPMDVVASVNGGEPWPSAETNADHHA